MKNQSFHQFQKYFKETISGIERLDCRGNNQLFKIVLNGKTYLLKKYSPFQADNYSRERIEFYALSYLWDRGFRNVPEPIKLFPKDKIGVYSFNEGRALKPEEVRKRDVLSLAGFIADIYNSNLDDKMKFLPERTSCLSLIDYTRVLDTRIKTITSHKPGNEFEARATEIVKNKVCPLLRIINKKFISTLNKAGLNLREELSLEEQVLSPGDFGFHNVLIKEDRHIFIDFEYFGRDDPARQVLHFLHHDKNIGISNELKNLFLNTIKDKVHFSERFENRLFLVDPFIGIEWILIYLNLFSEIRQKHAKFVWGNSEDITSILKERIIRAEKKIENIRFFQ